MSFEGLQHEMQNLIDSLKPGGRKRIERGLLANLQRACSNRSKGLDHIAIRLREGEFVEADLRRPYDARWLKEQEGVIQSIDMYKRRDYQKFLKKAKTPKPGRLQ